MEHILPRPKARLYIDRIDIDLLVAYRLAFGKQLVLLRLSFILCWSFRNGTVGILVALEMTIVLLLSVSLRWILELVS